MEDHIRFDKNQMLLDLLDQRKLPQREERFFCRSLNDIIYALKEMVVRGAPAIGVTAAFGTAILLKEVMEQKDWKERLTAGLEALRNARPTAVNLAWAVDHMRKDIWKGTESAPELLSLFVQEAEALQKADIASCKAIGQYSLPCIPQGARIMTHCNAGALATAGYGTALGVIRAAFAQDSSIRVIANETRPFLQGARLTAWELHKDGIPVTIACDNAAALLMAKGMVDCIVVGADRIAANGDTANKIGTSGLAILAKEFGIPFYIAAPLSTIDRHTAKGADIPIEQRPASEVTTIGTTQITPQGVPVYNFAFDVTPAKYITGIITDKGVLHAPYEEAIASCFAENSCFA